MIEAQTRNVTVRGKRTSIRLEQAFWSALEDILEREGATLNGLVNLIDAANRGGGNLSGAVRVFILSYISALAHQKAPLLPIQQDFRTYN